MMDNNKPQPPSFILPPPKKHPHTQPLYPLIGLDSYHAVHVNFGGPSNAPPGGNGRPRPFVFDVWRFQRELLGAEVVSLVLYVRVSLSSFSLLLPVAHVCTHALTPTNANATGRRPAAGRLPPLLLPRAPPPQGTTYTTAFLSICGVVLCRLSRTTADLYIIILITYSTIVCDRTCTWAWASAARGWACWGCLWRCMGTGSRWRTTRTTTRRRMGTGA